MKSLKQTGWQYLVKTTFDKAIAAGALVTLSPLLAASAIAVRTTMGAPVFFKQERPGRGGRPFYIIKLRTMTVDVSDNSPDSDSVRITRVGRFLRSCSIDEIPQLVNVLRGEMSIVGPRPLLMQYLDRYSPEQARRNDVLPGLTGWAQVNGRNAITWEEKFQLDTWYVDNWSIWLDCKIIGATFLRVLARRGVSSVGHATMPEFMGGSTPPSAARDA